MIIKHETENHNVNNIIYVDHIVNCLDYIHYSANVQYSYCNLLHITLSCRYHTYDIPVNK